MTPCPSGPGPSRVAGSTGRAIVVGHCATSDRGESAGEISRVAASGAHGEVRLPRSVRPGSGGRDDAGLGVRPDIARACDRADDGRGAWRDLRGPAGRDGRAVRGGRTSAIRILAEGPVAGRQADPVGAPDRRVEVRTWHRPASGPEGRRHRQASHRPRPGRSTRGREPLPSPPARTPRDRRPTRPRGGAPARRPERGRHVARTIRPGASGEGRAGRRPGRPAAMGPYRPAACR